MYCKQLLDRNPTMSLTALDVRCGKKFLKYNPKVVQEAFAHFSKSRREKNIEKDILESDPAVTESVLAWIALQQGTFNTCVLLYI